MSRKKIPAETKIALIEQYKRSEGSIAFLAGTINIHPESFRAWMRNYEACGADVFSSRHYQRYSSELKEAAVRDYLSGKGSQGAICKKYGIKSCHALQNWIVKYNSHEKFKPTGSGGRTIVTKGRKTTFEERVSIVADCIANGRDYNATAEKFHVSYQQVYTWVKKQEKKGIDG